MWLATRTDAAEHGSDIESLRINIIDGTRFVV
jgi:hypothetical protein